MHRQFDCVERRVLNKCDDDRAGLFIVLVVPYWGPRRQGAPQSSAKFFNAVLTFERAAYAGLNITQTTKERSLTFGRRKVHPTREKILGTRMRKWPPPYVGMGPPNG